ncbi:heavy-metal-associated domain-containing protein [Sinorhizobium sp. BG8]|uniref:heavy-metal-associated domain-containing protein n=1 Tax=Sinorhizobium sp. BG8 TaxID=2613773 RepID=UPI00193DB392|nr:heavy-metal-associated domain-containing protein [Sinorhizobium sp. BG8]QRM57292.1 heavy-metal-associated domain-containing protein [Sinorhizobium sp. BG8]
MTLSPDTVPSIEFTVSDMTCGHCVRAITTAIETALPNTRVDAETQTHRVTVSGADNADKIAEIIAAEGYTPVLVR